MKKKKKNGTETAVHAQFSSGLILGLSNVHLRAPPHRPERSSSPSIGRAPWRRRGAARSLDPESGDMLDRF